MKGAKIMKKLIALDDGHGMETQGKRTPAIPELGGRVIKENEFNRAVVNFLDIELKRCGFDTLLVAPGDADTSMESRTNLANSKNADAYVAIHFNAWDGEFNDYDPEGLSIHIYPGSVNGRKLAESVLNRLKQGTSQKNRGIVESNFHVLRESDMPAILSENGYMDNKREALLMLNTHYQKEVAVEHALGLCEYFNVPYKEEELLKYQKIRRYNSYVHVVEIDPAAYRIDITEGIPGKLEKLSSIFGEPKLDEIPCVRMNAQYWGSGSTRGYGAFIDNTDNLPEKESSQRYTDLTYKDGKLAIGTGGDFTIGTSYGLISRGITDFKNSTWWTAIMNARHPRSMAGCLSNGNNVFIVVDGRWRNLSLGMTAQQQAALGHELGCVELVNFDGGGSSEIIIGDYIKNRPSDGHERSIISAIVAYRKYTLSELPLLKKGKSGVYVNLAQRLLNSKGYNAGMADGIFGNLTLSATKVLQSKNSLVVDGIIASATWTKLIV
jgi:N-acetylmuramoyl-L-alanine amidase